MKKIISIISVLAISYVTFFGVVIFSFDVEVSEAYKAQSNVQRFYDDEIGPDRATVIDTPEEAALIRIHMLETARKSLDISYYSMEKGQSTSLFWALLLEAADRGVKVRILLDGVANGLKVNQKEVMYALFIHPNIELKFYEPVNLFNPQTINNRMHDKFIIADEECAIIGGRNIGDRFWSPKGYEGEMTYDRDAFIYNEDKTDNSSVLLSFKNYFNEVYNSPYSKASVNNVTDSEQKKGHEKIKKLKNELINVRKDYKQQFDQDYEWDEVTVETNKITLIYNPIVRGNKEPWVWYEINQLMKNAKESVLIQSPYIVPAKKMDLDDLLNEKSVSAEIKVLTNSAGSTPNFPAFSSYLNHKKKLIASGIRIYEYQGEHSIHAKTYSIDQDLSLVGSFNLDPRSAFLSTETMVVIQSREVNRQLNEILRASIENSLEVGKDGKYIEGEGDVKIRSVSTTKKVLLEIAGFLGRPVEFLL